MSATVEEMQDRYAIAQHRLCCKHLGIGVDFAADGDSLFEAVIRLEQERDQLRQAAVPSLGFEPRTTPT